ncbi:HEAT repeat domain-containing protein [Ornithinimicrobium panacihumi]|uniref:HEAT repeat domain-containing protein n=1 Tax=Ornithinimicrobium panacihumi TaxID=2008449 RepID=UPI003F8A4A73
MDVQHMDVQHMDVEECDVEKQVTHEGADMTTLEQAMLAVRHADPRVRQEAAMRLGGLADPSVGRELVDLLVAEPDFYVRETLTWVVVAQQESTLPHLVAALDGDAPSRVQVLHALSKIRDTSEDVVDRIVPLAQDDDPAVAAKAWWALGRTAEPRTAPVLVAHLGSGDDEVRRALTSALEQFGAPAVPALAEQLADPSPAVRRHALEALSAIGDPGARGAVDALVALVGRSGAKDELVLAVEALGQLDVPEKRAALERLRSGEDTWLATMADWLLTDLDRRREQVERRERVRRGTPDEPGQ